MRIGNPLPQVLSTIQVGGISAPTTFTTLATATLNNGATTDIPAITNQFEILIANLDTVATIFARDAAATTAGAGTPIGPKAIAALNINSTVRLTNNSGSNVSVAVNQTGRP